MRHARVHGAGCASVSPMPKTRSWFSVSAVVLVALVGLAESARADLVVPERDACRGAKVGDRCGEGKVCVSTGFECQAGSCRRFGSAEECQRGGCSWEEQVACQATTPSPAAPSPTTPTPAQPTPPGAAPPNPPPPPTPTPVESSPPTPVDGAASPAVDAVDPPASPPPDGCRSTPTPVIELVALLGLLGRRRRQR